MTALRQDPAGREMLPPVPMGQESRAERESAHAGAAVYRMLTGLDPAEAAVEDDMVFDRHVFASILAVAAAEGGAIGERVGLATVDLVVLIEQCFPEVGSVPADWVGRVGSSEDDETTMVRDLLLAHRSHDGPAGRWLAAMVARRAMEPNHLWEDLGLRDRSELSRLLNRHFATLATRNTKNMRWKRFFYRMLCDDDGLVMCSTPVCSHCGDFDLCFGDESGESRLAYQRRLVALKAESFPDPGEVAPPRAQP